MKNASVFWIFLFLIKKDEYVRVSHGQLEQDLNNPGIQDDNRILCYSQGINWPVAPGKEQMKRMVLTEQPSMVRCPDEKRLEVVQFNHSVMTTVRLLPT